MATSVPVFGARCKSAWRASGVARGSMTTSRAPCFCACAHVRDEVNARRRRVDAPEDDQPGLGIVLVGDARHLSVHRLRGGAGWRGTYRAREARGAEPAEQDGVERVLRQQSVRAAIRKGQNRFATPLLAGLDHAGGDELDRFVPGHTRETSLPLRADTHGRMLQPRLAVNALAELSDLGADVAGRSVRSHGAVDGDDAAVADGDRQAARVGAVEGARRIDDRLSAVRGLAP